MMTPRIPLLALALALAGAAPALAQTDPAPTPSADQPKQVLPADFIGPPAPNQCIAGTAGCTGTTKVDVAPLPDAAAAAGAATGAAAFAAAEQALNDVGRQQMMDSVKKDEDGMLKSGIYKSIDRTKDGSGAIITMPDGSVMWSDYVQGFDSMPQKDPQALLAMMEKNGGANPASIAALKAAIAQMDQKNGVNATDKQVADRNGQKMFGGSAGDAPAAPAPRPAAASPSTPSDGATAADPNAYAFNQGSSIGQSGLFGSGGATGAIGQGSPDQALTAAAPTVTPGAGVEALDPDGYEFTGVRKAARRAQAVLGETLGAQHGSDAGESDGETELRPDQTGRGFNSSVNH